MTARQYESIGCPGAFTHAKKVGCLTGVALGFCTLVIMTLLIVGIGRSKRGLDGQMQSSPKVLERTKMGETNTPPSQHVDKDIDRASDLRVSKSGGQGTSDLHARTALNIGRPERDDYAKIIGATTWDEFYKQCQSKSIRGEGLEDLIFRRVTLELALDEEKLKSLRELFKEEQESVTKTIFDNCGGASGFDAKQLELSRNKKKVLDEWRQQREIVRQSYEGAYLNILTHDQMGILNEHLRNNEIKLEVTFKPGCVYYLIAGVGKTR